MSKQSQHDIITDEPRPYADCALDALELHVDSPEEIAARKLSYANHIVDIIADKVVKNKYEITRKGNREVLEMRIDEAIVDSSDSTEFIGDRRRLIVETFDTRFPTKKLSVGTLNDRFTISEKLLVLGLCFIGIIPGCCYMYMTENGGCINRPRDYRFTIERR